MVIIVLQMFKQGTSTSWDSAEIIAALAQEHFVQSARQEVALIEV